MPIQTINLGTLANDGTGDDLRTAFEKIVNNFTHIESELNFEVSGINLGDGLGIYKDTVDNILEFNTISAGSNLRVTLDGNNIVLSLDIDSELDLDGQNIVNCGDIVLGSSNSLIGNVQGVVDGYVMSSSGNPIGYGNLVGANGPALVDGVPVADIARSLQDFDFGGITDTVVTTNAQYLLLALGLDLGTITAPVPFTIELGSIQ